jgi:hypothetical protein
MLICKEKTDRYKMFDIFSFLKSKYLDICNLGVKNNSFKKYGIAKHRIAGEELLAIQNELWM